MICSPALSLAKSRIDFFTARFEFPEVRLTPLVSPFRTSVCLRHFLANTILSLSAPYYSALKI